MRANLVSPTPGAPAPIQATSGLATSADAQAFLRVSRTTLYNLTRRGDLHPVRLGRALRYKWADLRRLAGEGGAQ